MDGVAAKQSAMQLLVNKLVFLDSAVLMFIMSFLHAPFENFTGIKFLFFYFKGFSEFSIKKLLNFSYMTLISQLHRAFFPHFTNRAVISLIFEWQSTWKAFIVI